MDKQNYPRLLKDRFFVNLIIKNILGKEKVAFKLTHSKLDEELILQVTNAAGFNSNHPYYDQLTQQVLDSFSIDEINQFISFVNALQVIRLTIELAVYRVNDPPHPENGKMYATIMTVEELFDFSTLAGYNLPFIVEGRYNPLSGG